MTFFSEAQADGTIDHRIAMSQQEFEMMLRGMLEDSNAWELHKRKHKDARMAPIFKEEELSEFEQHVNKNSKHKQNKFEEPSIIQYDSHTKMFTAGCNCGERFRIDVKNDKVEQEDHNVKMKELDQYKKNQGNDSYGRESASTDYDSKPVRQPAINYNSNSRSGMQYKN
jgi:hypothetical protein